MSSEYTIKKDKDNVINDKLLCAIGTVDSYRDEILSLKIKNQSYEDIIEKQSSDLEEKDQRISELTKNNKRQLSFIKEGIEHRRHLMRTIQSLNSDIDALKYDNDVLNKSYIRTSLFLFGSIIVNFLLMFFIIFS